MPRRFFRRFSINRRSLGERWYLRSFAHLLDDPRLWSVRRRSVTPAVALGIFIAWLPIVGHVVAAVLGALVMRVNIPVALAATFLSNPVTVGPMLYTAYRVGRAVLNEPPRAVSFELSLSWFAGGFLDIWQPLLLGSLLLGTATAAAAYFALNLVWRLSVSATLRRRRRRPPTP